MNIAKIKAFGQRWLISTVAVLVAAHVVPGIGYDNVTGLLTASLILGILNTFIRPVLIVLSLPLLVATLGLFTLVINAALLYLVGGLVASFHVRGFWPAFWGALIISVVSLFANWLLGNHRFHIEYRRGRNPPPSRGSGDDHGPIIDV